MEYAHKIRHCRIQESNCESNLTVTQGHGKQVSLCLNRDGDCAAAVAVHIYAGLANLHKQKTAERRVRW